MVARNFLSSAYGDAQKFSELVMTTFQSRHWERSEANQGRRTEGWIASLR